MRQSQRAIEETGDPLRRRASAPAPLPVFGDRVLSVLRPPAWHSAVDQADPDEVPGHSESQPRAGVHA